MILSGISWCKRSPNTGTCQTTEFQLGTGMKRRSSEKSSLRPLRRRKTLRWCKAVHCKLRRQEGGQMFDFRRAQQPRRSSPTKRGQGCCQCQGSSTGLSWDLTKREKLTYCTPCKAWKCFSPSATSPGLQANFQSYPKHEPPHQQMLSIYCQCKPFRLIKPNSFFF